MQRLYPDYCKIVANGGDLDAASPIRLHDQVAANVNLTRELIRHILSNNVAATEIIDIGFQLLYELTLAAATEADFPTYFGGTWSGTAWSKTQGTIETLSEFDVRLGVFNTSGSIVKIDATAMIFTGDYNGSFKQKGRFYLPVKCEASDGTVFSITP